MKILPPKKTKDEEGNEQNSLPDDAPPDYVSVVFDGENYVFREEGDDSGKPQDDR